MIVDVVTLSKNHDAIADTPLRFPETSERPKTYRTRWYSAHD